MTETEIFYQAIADKFEVQRKWSEVLPEFAPAVQEVWKNCGTYITSQEATVAEKELEYFVQYLIERIGDALDEYSLVTVNEALQELGYIK